MLGIALVLAQARRTSSAPASGSSSSPPRKPCPAARSTSSQRACWTGSADLALHCDPRIDVGKIGTRIGAITSASDTTVIVSAAGRPHLPPAPDRGPGVRAGQVITHVPAVLARRLDPARGVAMVWGRVSGRGGAQRDPERPARSGGTMRCLDARVWAGRRAAGRAVRQVVGPYGVAGRGRDHVRGVPPTVNDADAVQASKRPPPATRRRRGRGACSPRKASAARTSPGSWREVPGRDDAAGHPDARRATYDLHRRTWWTSGRSGYGARLLAADGSSRGLRRTVRHLGSTHTKSVTEPGQIPVGNLRDTCCSLWSENQCRAAARASCGWHTVVPRRTVGPAGPAA